MIVCNFWPKWTSQTQDESSQVCNEWTLGLPRCSTSIGTLPEDTLSHERYCCLRRKLTGFSVDFPLKQKFNRIWVIFIQNVCISYPLWVVFTHSTSRRNTEQWRRKECWGEVVGAITVLVRFHPPRLLSGHFPEVENWATYMPLLHIFSAPMQLTTTFKMLMPQWWVHSLNKS